MRKYTLLSVVIIYVFLSGCASSYLTRYTRYESYLLNSEPPETLQFNDDNFEFGFIPVPNGVYFRIINLNSKPAFLEWDRCYFIEPGGNSAKALNTDLLEENSETMAKAKYESILPPNGLFSRFTSSALNVAKFKNITVKEFNNYFMYFLNTKVVSNANEIDNYFLNGKVVSVEVEKFFKISRYWPKYQGPACEDSINGIDTIKIRTTGYAGGTETIYRPHIVNKTDTIINIKTTHISLTDIKTGSDTTYEQNPICIDMNLVKITDYILNNNNMGLGLGIKLNDTILDYKFDFRFKSVTISNIIKTADGKKIIVNTASESDGWKWKQQTLKQKYLQQ